MKATELGLGNGVSNLNLWKLNYDYDESLTAGGTANTGNLVSQTITIDGLAQPFVQTYKYDSLYRIKEAKETNNGNQTWIENYDYDRYGNRTTLTQNLHGNQLAANNLTHPTIDPTTNRFNPGQSYAYDKAGNITTDVDEYGNVRLITFNGDNKQTKITDNSSTPKKIGEYEYDGEGKRVKKKTFDSTTGAETERVIFVYSGGKLVAEYSTKPPPQNPITKYVATDTLQSVRAITNQDGEVVSRRDFLPFGKEIPNSSLPGHSSSLRTSALKYGGDDVRQKFTGYQKDEESGLDFAEARMYNNRHARFTAVDPLLASGKSSNPQTFNRYVYVMNSPLNLTDPTGLQAATRPWLGRIATVNSEPSGIPDQSMVWSTEKWEFQPKFPDRYEGGNILQDVRWGQFNSLFSQIQGGPFGNYPYPDPQGNPLGYELARFEQEAKFIVHGVTDMVYKGAPDYGKFQWATPVFAVEFSMTKDFDFFAGGSGMDFKAIADLRFADSIKALKPIPTLSVGYFVFNAPSVAKERRDAMSGGNVNLSMVSG